MRKIFLLLFLLSIYCNSAFSQMEQYSFSQMSVNDGLSEIVVNCIIQDQQGFIWIGTQNGLNRYDGYEFKIYKSNQKDSASLKNNNIKSLFCDSKGYLWVGTAGGGLHKYSAKTDNFKSYTYSNLKSKKNSISNNQIYSIAEDKNGNIWIATFGGGVNKLNPITDTFETYLHTSDLNSISNNSVRTLLIDKDQNIYLGTELGTIDVINIKTNKISHLKLPINNDNAIMHLCEDDYNNIWIGTYEGGLLKFNKKTKGFEIFTTSNSNLTNNIVWKIFKSDKNSLWLATRGGGINIFDLKTNKITSIQYSQLIPNSLTTNLILDIFKDESGIYWIGTENSGINILNTEKKNFKLIIPKFLFSEIKSNVISAFYHDSQDNYWIGVQENGLICYNPKKNISKLYNKNNSNISSNTIRAITEDANQNIWLGTDGEGIDIFNRVNKTFSNIQRIDNDTTSLSNNAIHFLLKDYENNIWIGTYGGGLNKYDFKTGKFKRFLVDADAMNNVVLTIFEDFNKTIWIGTANKGFAFLDIEGHFHFFQNDFDNPESLSNNLITCITQNNDPNYLWLGTGGSGITCFDISKLKFINFDQNDGLSNDVVTAIVCDSDNKLWISTLNGLNHFDPTTGVCRIYNEEDGLQGNNYSRNCGITDKEGNIYMGGENGLSIFNPRSSSNSMYSPKLVFTNFKISNETVKINEKIKDLVVLENSIFTSDQIILSYQHNLISFEFAALDYRNPQKITYQYLLEGIDDNWNRTTSDRRFITYTQLPPGRYTLKIQSTNSDGKWCENTKSIKLYIAPPFWKTSWFIIFTVLLLILIIFIIIKYQTVKLKRNNLILENNVAIRTKEIAAQRDEIYKQTGKILLQQEKIIDQNELLELKNRELEKLSIAAREVDNIIVIINKSGFIEWINDSFANQFNIPTTTDFNKYPVNYSLINHSDIFLDQFKECIRSKSSVNFEMEYTDRHNKRIYSQTSITPILNSDNEVERLVSVSSDISKLKVAEQQITMQKDQITKQHNELQIHRDNLEKLVAERTKALEEALHRAEESDLLKTSFLANISHEIRTPMNSIVGFTELLSQENITDDKKIRYINMINSNSESLIRLIDDIIDLSKIETGQIEFKRNTFNVFERFMILNNHVLSLIEKSKKKIKVSIKISQEFQNSTLYSDSFRIEQIMLNLLNNAVKYTESGIIEFGFNIISKEGEQFIHFFCNDSGVGLKDEQIEKIFNHFTKIEENKYKLYRGAGLGLAISKHIVELLGGEIWVKSEFGKGSSFNFTIPYVQNHELDLKTEYYFKNIKILIAEDEENNVNLLKAILESTKAKIYLAKDGQDAIDKSKELLPDIILMDIKLPVKDGYQAIKEIHETNPSIPIIAQTAYSLLSDKNKMTEFGFTELIFKPINRIKLLNIIKKIIETKKDGKN